MTPEVKILLINAAGLVLAYGLLYPLLLPVTLRRLVLADLAFTVALVGGVAALFGGGGLRMWLFGLHVSPVVFCVITLMAMEMPVFAWFAKKHGLLP